MYNSQGLFGLCTRTNFLKAGLRPFSSPEKGVWASFSLWEGPWSFEVALPFRASLEQLLVLSRPWRSLLGASCVCSSVLWCPLEEAEPLDRSWPFGSLFWVRVLGFRVHVGVSDSGFRASGPQELELLKPPWSRALPEEGQRAPKHAPKRSFGAGRNASMAQPRCRPKLRSTLPATSPGRGGFRVELGVWGLGF